MIQRLTAFLTIACVSVAGLTISHAQESYSLQYKFEKGRAYRFGDTITVNSTTEMMGQEMKSTSSVLSVTRAVATDVQSGGTTVFVVSTDTMNVTITSSRGDTTLAPREMIGKRTRFTMTKLGDVTNRETIDTVKIVGVMRAVGRRETIRFHAFSAKPVKIGGQWTSTHSDTSDQMGGKMVLAWTLDYTLLAKEKRSGRACLKVGYMGKVSVTGKGSMQGMEIFVEGSGTLNGKVFIDPTNGLPLFEESKAEMETSAAVTGQQNMTIPSSQSITTHRGLLTE
jgi:uncharacterized Zn finger protein